jgi:pimeloyl-ACP methyl ester carboxylesterase
MPSSLSLTPNHARPVILIHGYSEDSNIWSRWESLLQNDSIPYCKVSFQSSDDECGSAAAHATELSQIVQRVKMLTHENQVNMVGHSKGGLDTREYLDNPQKQDVANLIMIGTPNGGDLLANEAISNPWRIWDYLNISCLPALYDLQVGAHDTITNQNMHTNYHVIAGVCFPYLIGPLGIVFPGNNDGVVPESSVKSELYFHKLPNSPNCHMNLFGDYEYGLSKSILKNR